ncbi:MAG: protein kinase [Sedimentisphaerales bacterium]|nr:protein kinase [Sedimentisphaerales bacterium]
MQQPIPANTDIPYELVINHCTPQNKNQTVLCEELLRKIDGKRSVYRGRWQNHPVIIKIFEKGFGAKAKLLKEWQGFNELKKRKINTPETYFYGHSNNGGWVMVIEEICKSETAIELFNRARSNEQKLEILRLLLGELAKLNTAGVMQTDLHMGNFLIRGTEVYPLDTARMKFFGGPIDREASIKQAALLCWYIPKDAAALTNGFLEQYVELRGWKLEQEDKLSAQRYTAKHNRKAIRKGLKKCLRTSTRQVRKKRKDYLAVFDREFFEKLDAELLPEKIDSLMRAGQILKSGRTCFVSLIESAGVKVAVKRYNHKGFLHSLRHTAKGSRARKSWIKGHLLGMISVQTPKPLAFIEQYKGSLLRQAYILTKYVNGRNLHRYKTEEKPNKENLNNIMSQIKDVVEVLHQNRITHGDIKKSNILVTDDSICITDLDAMIRHRTGFLYSYYKKKDAKDLQKLIKELF